MEKHTGDNFFLEPGHIYRCVGAAVLRTVVGNGVCVCLWDKRRAIGVMSHFIRPAAPARSHGTPVYGNVSTRAALRLMREAGSRSPDMIAHIIGGANHAAFGGDRIGDENVRAARECLKRGRIAIYAEDTGGGMGRKVSFDTATGHVAVMKVHQLRQKDWLHDGAA